MAMSRPFFSHSISDLEKTFEERQSELAVLDALAKELVHRQTERAKRLADRVHLASQSVKGRQGFSEAAPTTASAHADAPSPAAPSIPRIDTPMPPVSNAAEEILGAWTALEALNPQTFRNPHELASKGDRTLVADLTRGLPWEIGDRGRPNKKLFYHVLLGTIDTQRAFEALLERYVDFRAERPRVKPEAILASVVVDKNGILVADDAVAVSSFGWALPIALTQDLSRLSAWTSVTERIHAGLAKQLRQKNQDGQDRPLDRTLIQGAYDWLLHELKLPASYARAPRVAIRVFQDFRLREPPDALLLNSFYLGDLARAQASLASGQAPKALRLYLGQDKPTSRRDLLHDTSALEEAVAPSAMPPARWPAPGGYPLVLLQQAAVNLALNSSQEPGIVAVNGPPGTGKTTLLRDVVAALVTRRAEAMCGFEDPARAFSDSGQRLKLGSESANLYTVDRRLRGFEILVASSNNGAVENVSAELPAQSAVAADSGLNYFKPLADVLLDRPTWGLIAGVLGNAGNRARFARTFWWDADVGFATYLAEAAGTPQWIEEPSASNGPKRRRPRLIEEASAPSSHAEAIRRWQDARSAFRARLKTAEELLKDLEVIRCAIRDISVLEAAAASSSAARDMALITATQTKTKFHAALSGEAAADAELKNSEERLRTHDAVRPGFISRLFRLSAARQWAASRAPLAETLQSATTKRDFCKKVAFDLESDWKASETTVRKLVATADADISKLVSARRVISDGRDRLGDQLVDSRFFERSHDARHKSVPWCDAVAHQVRDELFGAAMAIHKAFVDAAAKPIRGNLAGLMKAMGATGTSAFSGAKAPLLPEVWATLFLVVPVISTTFASVERMLGALPAESLGWLLIDEAGQALPQAAVGAILRCRRAVVVGDPVQIEPVVPLPESLTKTICRRFGVDPDRFNAPEASAQTLADSTTPYMAEFLGRQGSRTVGVPLLVHRRCAEPMFGIANAAAYQNLMVHAKGRGTSRIADCLGPSRWIDVHGPAQDKWCAKEGEVVVSLMRKLAEASVSPNVYIITPFRIVEENLSRLLLDSGVMTPLTSNPSSWINEHVGTVHTVQGREAEAVIFVLGAPLPEQYGARSWAGGRPNLLNVALTRAQEVVYVVGNRALWREAGVFSSLDSGMPS